MFIELHRLNAAVITISLDKIEYFCPTEFGTMISIPNYNGWLKVTETYEQVKELVDNAIRYSEVL